MMVGSHMLRSLGLLILMLLLLGCHQYWSPISSQ